MLRRSVPLRVPQWTYPNTAYFFPRLIGYHLEDHSSCYDLQLYTHPQVMRVWYTRHERFAARNWALVQQRTESHAYNSGLHFSGDGPFERELKRKGIQVEKYRLPSTVAVKRVNEMVVLRRKALETKSGNMLEASRKKLMTAALEKNGEQQQQQQQHLSWMDESDGPLNPQFLRMTAGKNYPAYELPRTPILLRQAQN